MTHIFRNNLPYQGIGRRFHEDVVFDHDTVTIPSKSGALTVMAKILSVNLAGFTKWDDNIFKMDILPDDEK